jgi:hypothetical protein
MDNGYVKIFRTLQDKGYYKDSEYVHLWVHLLMSASWKEKEYLFNGFLHVLQPGQFITGRNSLSKDTGIHRSKIDRILTLFESEHQIEQQKTNKFRIISICNWDKYQISEHQIEQQMSNKRASSEHQVSTIKKEKKDKKEKNNTNTSVCVLPDWFSESLWKRFLNHRVAVKAPIKNDSYESFYKKFEKLKTEGWEPEIVIDTMIEKGWRWFKPEWVKDYGQQGSNQGHGNAFLDAIDKLSKPGSVSSMGDGPTKQKRE